MELTRYNRGHYLGIQKELLDLHDQKIFEYGTSRYEFKQTELMFQAIFTYSDVNRKFIRIKEQLLNRDIDGLRETYGDLGNYAIMGMQVIDLLTRKDTHPFANRISTQGADQIAINVPIDFNFNKLENTLQSLFGDRLKFSRDTVTARGTVNGVAAQNRAELFFCYGLIPGIELEFLKYIEGDNFLKGVAPFSISHIGFHCDDNFLPGVEPIQEVMTVSHTNPFLVSTGRRYKYKIYGTRAELGFDTKFITRFEGKNDSV